MPQISPRSIKGCKIHVQRSFLYSSSQFKKQVGRQIVKQHLPSSPASLYIYIYFLAWQEKLFSFFLPVSQIDGGTKVIARSLGSLPGLGKIAGEIWKTLPSDQVAPANSSHQELVRSQLLTASSPATLRNCCKSFVQEYCVLGENGKLCQSRESLALKELRLIIEVVGRENQMLRSQTEM